MLDADGQLVALSTATSLMHAASLRCSLRRWSRTFPLATMRPGDVYALNDPYRGGIHANDILVFRPVFADDGGSRTSPARSSTSPTSAACPPVAWPRSPPTRSPRACCSRRCTSRPGEPARRRAAHHRRQQPNPRQGDRRHAGAHRGRQHDRPPHREMHERSVPTRWRGRRAGHRRLRAPHARRCSPHAGRSVRGTFTIDSDGFEARTFEVRVAVTSPATGDRHRLAGTSPQAGGAINASVSQTMSGVVYAVRCFADPSIPMNEGCFRPFDGALPPRDPGEPVPPAACGGRLVTVAAATEAILAALAQAVPDRAVAASSLIQVSP